MAPNPCQHGTSPSDNGGFAALGSALKPAPLSAPRCDPCGERVFDYLGEQQIKGALEARSTGLGRPANGTAAGSISTWPCHAEGETGRPDLRHPPAARRT